MGINYAFTHQQPDGNRYVVGQGNMPNAPILDIELSGAPRWLVAAPLGDGSIWVAVLEDGGTQAFLVEDRRAVETAFSIRSLPAGSPPMLAVAEGEVDLLTNRSDLAARFSHTVPVGDGGQVAFIEVGGETWSCRKTALRRDGWR